MWRSVKSNGLCDLANLSWAKDAVLAQAVRELTYEAANTTSPNKTGGVASRPMRLNASGALG